jgi:ribonuclease BN (tRNA processing enzyme)
MKLLLLGTAGYHPNQRRHTACLMLPEVGVVLDAGTGMFRVREHLATPRLDIFLSHAHLDHVVGLTYLIDVVHARDVAVTVHATADKLAAIQQHLLATELFPAPLPCRYQPLAGDVPLAGGGTLTYFPLAHPGGAIGLRLDWPGRSLAYVTDTSASGDAPYVEAIRGVDLLVHECNFADDQAELAKLTGHSTTSAVAQVAQRAGVGRLLLVHVNPLAEAETTTNLQVARGIFADTLLGEDEMVVEF